MEPVHFFDLKSSLPGPLQCWSPNTSKTRILLNFRKIPYTQEWISYPDIEDLSLSLGLPPISSGTTPMPYCLPAILHSSVVPSSGLTVSSSHPAMSDSFPIALHLEHAFSPSPSTHPSIFPHPSSRALALLTQTLVSDVLAPSAYNLVAPGIPDILDQPRGSDYFVETRTRTKGMRPQELGGDEENQARLWKAFEANLGTFLTILSGEEGKGGPFLEGNEFGYADAILMGVLVWFHRGNRKGWERIMEMGGERVPFRRLWEASEQWVDGQGEERVREWKGRAG